VKKSDDKEKSINRWLAISLRVPRESIDAVSNFLMEQGATGIEEGEEDPKGERLKAYFLRNGREEGVFRALRRYLKSLRAIQPGLSQTKIKVLPIPEQNWGENWKRFFKPVRVTLRFVIKPPWSSFPLRKNQISIDITPGMAFGTGTHATTKLSIRALEERLKKKRASVLDVGTGSGILSIVAARLGAKEVLGIDTDPVAVEAARENVSQNGVSNIVKIRKGSIGHIRMRFDVVVANIDLKSLRRMRKPLLNHLENQGFLILSGILEGEKDGLRQHFIETGFLQWGKDSQEGEWVCLIFKKKKES